MSFLFEYWSYCDVKWSGFPHILLKLKVGTEKYGNKIQNPAKFLEKSWKKLLNPGHFVVVSMIHPGILGFYVFAGDIFPWILCGLLVQVFLFWQQNYILTVSPNNKLTKKNPGNLSRQSKESWNSVCGNPGCCAFYTSLAVCLCDLVTPWTSHSTFSGLITLLPFKTARRIPADCGSGLTDLCLVQLPLLCQTPRHFQSSHKSRWCPPLGECHPPLTFYSPPLSFHPHMDVTPPTMTCRPLWLVTPPCSAWRQPQQNTWPLWPNHSFQSCCGRCAWRYEKTPLPHACSCKIVIKQNNDDRIRKQFSCPWWCPLFYWGNIGTPKCPRQKNFPNLHDCDEMVGTPKLATRMTRNVQKNSLNKFLDLCRLKLAILAGYFATTVMG